MRFLARSGSVAGFAILASCSSTPHDAPAIADAAVDDSTADAPAPPGEDAGPDSTSRDAGADAPRDAIADRAPETETDAAKDASTPPTYLNPVIGRDFPDPFILRQGSTYYAFATNAGTANIQAARSTDLAHWTPLPDALPALPAWAEANAGLTWAPSILQRGPAAFVMYYAARDTASGFQCISRAQASSPAGPYVDSSSSAFVCQVSGAESLCGSIDPSPFVDADGTAYLVWKSDENAPACNRPPRLWSAPLTADGLGLNGPPSLLLTMDQPWQQPVVEGPSMTAIAGDYYLLYSANDYESAAYAMGYATCLSPTGPCVNVSAAGPLVSSVGSALGPGGGEFFDDAVGGRWLVYHAWTAPETTYAGGGARSMRIDRLVVDLDAGVLSLAGPTTSPQPL
jgi:beta-xylosidase